MASWLQDPLPEKFGRYRVVKMIGQGGMGVVYLARDTQLDREVALKVPHNDPVRGKKFLDRFEHEARAAARVHHPNICPIFDVGEISGKRYLTMAFIDGISLSRWLRKGKRCSPRQAAHLIRKLALALHEAHQRGVVHRDLKPSNIMIDRRGEPIIMDFGLARRFQSDDARLTRDGTTMGTPTYMAPEQCTRDRQSTPSCDIYGLGVILYELLAGKPPFTGDDGMAVLAKVLTEEPQPPSVRRPDTDPELERICLKAMAKKPDDRYPTTAALAAELTTYLKSTAGGGSATAAVVPILLDDDDDEESEEETAGRIAAGAPPRGVTDIQSQPTRRAATLPSEKPPEPRQRASALRVPVVWWIAGGAVVAVFLVVVLVSVFVLYRMTDYGTCTIELSEPNAPVTVRVDGAEVNIKAPGGVRLAPGEHELEASGKGYDTVKLPFKVNRGANPPLQVALAPQLATITISLSDPMADVQIKIDGKAGFRHGQMVRLMPRQQHVVEVTGGGYKNVMQPFTLEPGAVLTMNVHLERAGGPEFPRPRP
jgi:predicted Ser/Thr protein kinase